jgi:hypothetical protein
MQYIRADRLLQSCLKFEENELVIKVTRTRSKILTNDSMVRVTKPLTTQIARVITASNKYITQLKHQEQTIIF